MSTTTRDPRESDRFFDCPGGRLAARETGDPDAPLAICVPGLSANLISFDRVVEALPDHHVVALDLRGRGQSEITGEGSYGWPAHAADVLAVADACGAETFDLLGHSMGGFISLVAHATYPERLRRVVTIDAAGLPDPTSLGPIGASVGRLGASYPSRADYLDAMRGGSVIGVWDELWDRYYSRELEDTDDGGVRVRTSLAAVGEDATYGSTQDPYSYWPRIQRPTLLVRALHPMTEGTGLIVTAEDAERFAAEVAHATVVDVEANHYTIVQHPDSLAAIARFLAV